MDLKIIVWVFGSWFNPSLFTSDSLSIVDFQGINVPSFWNVPFSSFHFHFSSHLSFEYCSLTCLADSPFLSPQSPYSFVTEMLYILLFHFLICFGILVLCLNAKLREGFHTSVTPILVWVQYVLDNQMIERWEEPFLKGSITLSWTE